MTGPGILDPALSLHPLLAAGLMMLCGVVAATLAGLLGAPRITGYLVAGLLLSPSLSGGFTAPVFNAIPPWLTEFALAVIAFSIGSTLKISQMHRLGRQIFWITGLQGVGAFVFTLVAIGGFGLLAFPPEQQWTLTLPLALVVGAISAATAPAATLAIVYECESRGPLTTILLGVVALDDALSIVFFALMFGLAQMLIHDAGFAWSTALVGPLIHIASALGVGVVCGALLHGVKMMRPRHEVYLGLSLAATFLAAGLAQTLGSSSLLACMVLGFYAVNRIPGAEHLFERVQYVEEAIFGLFFVHAGAHFNPAHLNEAGLLALLIMAGRFGGKLTGSWLGATVSGASREVRRYLGLGLLPKAGVTVGLVLVARSLFGDHPFADTMVSAVLASVILNELVAPFLVRYALRKAGESVECRRVDAKVCR